MSDFTAFSDALPPQNVEAEEAILGGILLDPEAMGRVADLLSPEAFYDSTHRILYQGALALHRQGKPTDLMTVTSWLRDQGVLNKVGGMPKLAQLVEGTVSAVNIDRYAALVNEKHARRQLIGVSYEIAELGYDTAQETDQAFDEAERSLLAVTQGRLGGGTAPLSDIAIDYFRHFEQLQSGEARPGVPTGFLDLDAMTGGFAPGDLILLAARPSMGKTGIATNMAVNMAKAGEVVAIFSLEMSQTQLFSRMVSGETGIAGDRLRTGKVSEDEVGAIAQAIGTLSELPIHISESSNPTIGQIRSDCRALTVKSGRIGMVLIDYLQLMGGGGDGNRVQELSHISRSLKGLAREINAPILALSQLSRGVESRNNKRPVMSDIRDSGAIEQDADVIAMLYRDEYYDPDTRDQGIAELILVKHRNGPTGTVRLLFDNATTRFANLYRG